MSAPPPSHRGTSARISCASCRSASAALQQPTVTAKQATMHRNKTTQTKTIGPTAVLRVLAEKINVLLRRLDLRIVAQLLCNRRCESRCFPFVHTPLPSRLNRHCSAFRYLKKLFRLEKPAHVLNEIISVVGRRRRCIKAERRHRRDARTRHDSVVVGRRTGSAC